MIGLLNKRLLLVMVATLLIVSGVLAATVSEKAGYIRGSNSYEFVYSVADKSPTVIEGVLPNDQIIIQYGVGATNLPLELEIFMKSRSGDEWPFDLKREGGGRERGSIEKGGRYNLDLQGDGSVELVMEFSNLDIKKGTFTFYNPDSIPRDKDNITENNMTVTEDNMTEEDMTEETKAEDNRKNAKSGDNDSDNKNRSEELTKRAVETPISAGKNEADNYEANKNYQDGKSTSSDVGGENALPALIMLISIALIIVLATLFLIILNRRVQKTIKEKGGEDESLGEKLKEINNPQKNESVERPIEESAGVKERVIKSAPRHKRR